MNDASLHDLLAGAPLPDATAACDAVAERAVELRAARAASGADSAGPGRRPPRPFAERGWAVGLAAVVALLAVAVATPPGRAALADAADLIGRIGGAPASDGDAGLESTVTPGRPGSPTVVGTGTAPDGSRYEWVAYRRMEGTPGRPRRAALDTFCIRFAWADAPGRRATGGCGSVGSWSPGVVHMTGRLLAPRAGSADRDYMVSGDVDPRVGRLRVFYRRPDGTRDELPVRLARVDGKLLRRAGGSDPFAVWTAFVPAELVRADRLRERHPLMALSLVDPTFPTSLPYTRAYKRCVRDHGGFYDRGWLDVAVYDRRDRLVATLPTRASRPRVSACEEIPQMPPSGLIPGARPVDTPAFRRLMRAFPPKHPMWRSVRPAPSDR